MGGRYKKYLAMHLLCERFLPPLFHDHSTPPPRHDNVSINSPLSLLDGDLFDKQGSLDERELWSRGSHSSSSDASVFINENDCGAISALLEPLVSAVNTPNKNLKARLAFNNNATTPKGCLPLHCVAECPWANEVNANSTQYVGYDGMAISAEQHWQEEQPFEMNLNSLN